MSSLKSRLDALAYLHRIFDEVRNVNTPHGQSPPSRELAQLLSGNLSLDEYLEQRFERWATELSPALDPDDLEYVRAECVSFVKEQVLTSRGFRAFREPLLREGKMGDKRKGTAK